MKDWDRRKDDPDATWNRPRAERSSRRRKDLKTFCRGNPKMPHETSILLGSYATSYRQIRPGVRCSWRWLYRGGIKRDSYYSCSHEERCVRCGKIVRDRIEPRECPEFLPFDPSADVAM